jgi:hypothetical protein
LLFCIFSVPILSLAANHYVRAGATGSGSGSDWTNAYTNLPSSLVRGDTYYVAAGNYGVHTFEDALSGTTLITVKVATVADHGTSTGWSDTYAGTANFGQFIFHTGYYDVTGSSRTSLTSGYGLQMKIGVSGPGYAIWFQDPYTISHVTISYLEMIGIGYGNTATSGERGIYGDGGNSVSNITLDHMYFHDFGYCEVPILTRNWDTVSLTYSEINITHQSSPCHMEEWSDGGTSNVTVAYNVFSNTDGTAVITELNSGTQQTANNWAIYGNVFAQTDSATYNDLIDDGVIACINSNVCSNWVVYNNTFANFTNIQLSGTVYWTEAASGSSVTVNNNIWYNSKSCGPTGVGVSSDYNYYINCTGGVPSEPNGQTGTADIFRNASNGDFHLTMETKDGLHLPSPFDLDPDGVSRGTDNGIWSRGAFQLISTTQQPTPPQSLTVQSVH